MKLDTFLRFAAKVWDILISFDFVLMNPALCTPYVFLSAYKTYNVGLYSISDESLLEAKHHFYPIFTVFKIT